MKHDFDIIATATPSGWTAFNRATGAIGSGAGAEAALGAVEARRGSRVMVASDAVFSQMVHLPETQTCALAPAELEGALFYEVEPFCAIARENAMIAFERTGAGEWSVYVASRRQFEGIRSEVASCRMRLAGVVALPAGMESVQPDAVAASLFPENGPQSPVIVADRAGGIGGDRLVRVGIVAAAALALICLSDFVWLSVSAKRLRPRLAASEAAAAANENIRRQIAADEERVRSLESAKVRRESAAAELAVARDRWFSLFSALAETTGDDFALVSIESAGGTASAKCIAPSASAASGAMARLSAVLSEKGWTLTPGKVEELPGGLASFAFRLWPSGKGGR